MQRGGAAAANYCLLLCRPLLLLPWLAPAPARSQGVYCTLDELLTAEDLDQMRRQLMRGGGGPRSAAAGLRPLAAGA